MYRADVTQSIEPASPNFGTLAKGEEARAAGAKYASDSTSTLLKAAETLVKTGVEIDLSRTDLEAEKATQEFLQTNMAAEKANPELQALVKARPASTSETTVIDTYNQEFTRLRNASLGGMSNEEYVSRVSALSRKAIAKYPGLSDKIRERVGTITGLPYADQWAEMQFVKERFSKEKKDTAYDPMKAVMADIAATAPLGTFGGQEELLKLYNTDRAEYDRRMFSANQLRANKTGLDALKTGIESRVVKSDDDATQVIPSLVGAFQGALGNDILGNSVALHKDIFTPIAQLLAEGKQLDLDPRAFDTHVKMYNANIKTSIERAAFTATSILEKTLADNPNISPAKREEMKKAIADSRDAALRLYADDKGIGAAAMSTIMVNYRDKTLAEQRSVFDSYVKYVSALNNPSLVQAFFAKGTARDNLKITNPDFYNLMEQSEKARNQVFSGITTQNSGDKSLAQVAAFVDSANKSDGKAVPTVGIEPPLAKAGVDVLVSNAKTALDKAVAGKLLTQQDVTLISSAFSTAIDTGGMSQVFAADHAKLGAKIKLLPDADQAFIKGNMSNTSKSTVVAMSSLKDGIEAKYSITLQLGVNDAGQIMAMPTGVGTPRAGLTGKSANVRVIPSAEEYAAIQEYNSKSKALSSNLIYGRIMLTGENVLAVSNEYASLINSKQPYKGFFNTEPTVPKAATTTPAGTSTTPAGNTILLELESLK